MRVAVCIKQVPSTNEVEMDQKTGVLIREKKGTKINPNDLSALESALQIKDIYNAGVTSFTMGPPRAKEVIMYSYSMGVDEGILITDTKFVGSDVYTTSYTLAQGIAKSNMYDVIICGKYTIDGDTGQVGPSLAEHLGIPHVYGVSSVDKIEEKEISVTQRLGNSKIQLKIIMPCVLIVNRDGFTPRLPSLKLKLKAKKMEIKLLTFKDMFDNDAKNYGLSGSPTQVEKIFLPEKKNREKILTGNAEILTSKIITILKKQKVI